MNEQENRPHGRPIGKVSQEKPKDTFWTKFKRVFLSEDADNLGEYLVKDQLIPAAKDILIQFIETALWGDSRPRSGVRSLQDSTRWRGAGARNEATRYDRPVSSGLRSSVRARDRRTEVNDIGPGEMEPPGVKMLHDSTLFFSYKDYPNPKMIATEIKESLLDYYYSYNRVPAAFLLELIDEPGDWSSNYYGWDNLTEDSIRVVSSRNGYSLVLPRPVRFKEN